MGLPGPPPPLTFIGCQPPSVSQPVSGGGVLHGPTGTARRLYLIKAVERRGHPRHCLDAALRARDAPRSRIAGDSLALTVRVGFSH